MAFTPLPANLYEYFNTVNQRISKVENARSGAQDSADSAQSTANSAQSAATTALANAATAYTAAQNSLQPSAYAIQDPTTKQLTAINSVGVTVYTNSPTTGARVVMNSNGLAGYNASGGTTFAISASDGSAHFAGSITGSSITGSTLNINGNFVVDGTGLMTCTGASVTGSLYSTNGTIGGFNISSYSLSNSSGTIQLLSSGNGQISLAGEIFAGSIDIGGQTPPTNGLGVYGNSSFGGTIEVGSTAKFDYWIYANTLGTTTSGLPVYQVQSGTYAGYLKPYTSAQRFKKNIKPIDSTGYASIIENINPVTYDDIEDATQKDIPGLIAEQLAQVKGMEGLVVYDGTGQTMGINYEKLGVMIILALKELNIDARLKALEAK